MPIYEYECKACGHHMEAFQKMSEDPLKDCPLCNKSQLQKQVSAAGFQLKGSGWYKTDYTGKKEPKKENAAGDSKGSTEKTEKKKETDEKRT